MNEPENRVRREYDMDSLSGEVRGKYYEKYVERTNVVVIDPDLSAAFPNAKAVNEALRTALGCRRPAADEH